MEKNKRAFGEAWVKKFVQCEGENVPGMLQTELDQFK